MNRKHQITLLFLKNFSSKKLDGFTLIELLVVVIIVGILAAAATPILYSQIGKARESDALVNLGSIARSQQAYHFLYGEFALTLSQIKADSGVVSSKYYDLDNITGSTNIVKLQAIPFNSQKDQVRNYAIGVYFNSGAYDRATCQGLIVGSPVQVGNLPTDPCTDGGTKIK